jgi:hypothetical protein
MKLDSHELENSSTSCTPPFTAVESAKTTRGEQCLYQLVPTHIRKQDRQARTSYTQTNEAI